ncbi:MAG: FAD-dependent oxidoreductase [Hyphomicrobiales bacterium]|nr:FAD-dependent oxidoreductase [Hyphomicrobiales bacterium]MCY4053885.1 FAD-dependent oxidoreductase [Hyphomicrobiales bacterium]
MSDVVTIATTDGFHDLYFDSFCFGAKYIPLMQKHWRKRKFVFGRTSREGLADEYDDFTRHRILDTEPDVKGLRQTAWLFRQEYPDAMEMHFENSWAGQIDFMPDELPVIAPYTAIPGLAIAAGFSGHGFGLVPVVDRSMVELLASN